MTKNEKRSRAACHHEAGHCVSRWYLGARTDFAEVFDAGAGPRGILLGPDHRAYRSSGRTSGKALMLETSRDLRMEAPQEVVDSYRRIGRARAEMQLLSVVAGAVAEARYRRAGLVDRWLADEADREIARRVGSSWIPDLTPALDDAFDRAEALMRSTAAWNAVTTVAKRLGRNGRIDDREIDAMCEFAFGRQQPGLFDWNDHWPVGIGPLRGGWLPPDHQTEDGIPEEGVKWDSRA